MQIPSELHLRADILHIFIKDETSHEKRKKKSTVFLLF